MSLLFSFFSKIKIFLVLSLLLVGCANPSVQCDVDSDCVSKECCHPTSCVASHVKTKASCVGALCSLECRAGTMDCGQGSCKCVDSKCKAVLK